MKIEVLTRTKCTKCNGQGTVTHPLWEEFYKADDAYKEKHGMYMSNKEMYDWWLSQGFYIEQIPTEEIDCQHCKGNRYIEKWIPIDRLTDLIKK